MDSDKNCKLIFSWVCKTNSWVLIVGDFKIVHELYKNIQRIGQRDKN